MKLLLSLHDISFRNTKSIGIYQVAMGLAKALMHQVDELHIISNEECTPQLGNIPNKVALHLADAPVPRGLRRLYWDQYGIMRFVKKIKPDWLLLPKGFAPYFWRSSHCKLACYLHDLNWEYYLDAPYDAATPYRPWQMHYFSRSTLRSLERADCILCSSHFNRERFLHWRPTCSPQVVGIGFEPTASAPPQGRDLLCYVSPFPHKLSRLTLRYLAAWVGERQDLRIHLIGKPPMGWVAPNKQWVQEARLSQEALDELIRTRCRVCIYSSAYEGYGMPPVECLRMGIPCLSSDIPPIRENIPEQYLFKNDKQAHFSQQLTRLYEMKICTDIPPYPSWNEVTSRCLAALSAHA